MGRHLKAAGYNRPEGDQLMKTLKCGLLPGESRPMAEQLNEPLRAYLEQRLGIPVQLVVGESYVATGEALRRGQIDLAYLGPVTYILQSRATGLEPFARPTHGGSTGPTFKSAIIVPLDSPLESLSQLRGGEIGMGDLASTSGAWVPRHMLLNAGLSMERDYMRYTLGSHDQVIKAVAGRQVRAGGVSLAVLQRLQQQGRLDALNVRVLAESPPIPEYMWTFRDALPSELREAIREAFIQLRDPTILSQYAAESFIPAVDADVDRVRRWMENILQARFRAYGEADSCPREASPEPAPQSRPKRANTDGRRGVVLAWRQNEAQTRRH